MRCGLMALAFLALASPVRAGVYNLAEIHPFVPLEEVRGYLLRVRSASLPHKNPLPPESFKAQVLAQVAMLEKSRDEGTFSTLERVNLSACYLRLGRAEDAVRLLLPGDMTHFLVQSNLAAAYFLSGHPEMAVRHQERALGAWPEVWAGWSDQTLRHFRESEQTLLRLYRSRLEESRRNQRDNLDLDPLFPRLRFVNSEGEYEAGALAPAMRDLIPANGFSLLYQLNLWFPGDMRLYWQFAEVANVMGAVDQAFLIVNELVETGFTKVFKDLYRHRRELRDALPVYREAMKPVTRAQLLAAMLLIPRGTLAPPVVGDVAHVCASLTPTLFTHVKPPIEEPRNPLPATVVMPFNYRHVAVSFGFGFLMAIMLGFQWQEWRRRRQLAAQSRHAEPTPVTSRPAEP